MNYPVNCNKCNQPLYGPVKYCPFCGAASVSVTATSEKQNLDAIRAGIDSSLKQGEYTPGIRESIRRKGKEIGITEETSDSLLLAVLKKKGFSPAEEGVDDLLSVCWYSPAKWGQIEQERLERGRKELDSIIEGILADAVFEPRELSSVKEKGKQIDYSEEQILSYFEKKLLEHGFSPDPDADIKLTDAIHKKLSAIWRTEEKHLEVSGHKFQTFLDGKLHNGIYSPDDYVSITEAAPSLLRRDIAKLKATLIGYLKEKGFKPVGEIRPGNDLAVEWKTDWAKLGPLPPPPVPLFLKLVLVSGLAIAVLSGIFLLKKQGEVNPYIHPEGPIVTPPEGPDTPPVPHIEPVIENLSVSMLDMNNNPIGNLVSGQTIKLESEYTIVAPPDLKMVEVEENNYLVMPNGTRSPDAIRIKQRGTGRVMSKQSITLPNELPPGFYTHVATVKVGDKINKATQIVMAASGENKHEQEQLVRQREIDDYFAEGKQFFENGKYELCIEKMKEVIKRDNNNSEAQQYIRMATQKIEDIRNHFRNPTFGGSE